MSRPLHRLLLSGVFFACAARPLDAEQLTEVHYVMGTYFSITAEHGAPVSARAAMRQCFQRARALESHFSRYDPDSELNHLNAAESPSVAISSEMQDLLSRSLALTQQTGGRFDARIGRLSQIWRAASTWPAPATVSAALPSATGAPMIGDHIIRRGTGEIYDFDGIAKGYAIDTCVDILRRSGINRALLNLGESSVFAMGAPAGASGWRLSLRSLDSARRLGTLTLCNQALSVSSVFGHEHRIAARRVGHIIDPRDGLPLRAAALAVVVANNATDAEAYSKALLIEQSRTGHATIAAAPLLEGAIIASTKGWTRLGRVTFRADNAHTQIKEPLL